MNLHRNIDLVQINVTSNQNDGSSHSLSYYLPKSVDWKDRVISKIVVADPNKREYNILSPTNGKRVLTYDDFLPDQGTNKKQGIYVDLYRKDGTQLARNLSINELLASNPHPYTINSAIDLEQSMLHIPGKLYATGCILLYIFYDEVEEEKLPNQSITVRFSLAPGEKLSFMDLVNNYVHIQPNKIRGIIDWTQESAPCYLMLRDFNGQTVINNVLTTLLRTPSEPQVAYPVENTNVLRNQLYLPMVDINFDYSYIQNAIANTSSQPVEKIITFEY